MTSKELFDMPWEQLVATDPKKWWNLRKVCLLEELADLDKRAKTKENIKKRKVFQEMLDETEKLLTTVSK